MRYDFSTAGHWLSYCEIRYHTAAGKVGNAWGTWNVHDGDSVVVKDGRNIFGRELVGGVANEQAGLPNSTVTDDNTPGSGFISYELRSVAGVYQFGALTRGVSQVRT